MTLFVFDLVDENGAPISLYREGVSFSGDAAVSTVSAVTASVNGLRPLAASRSTTASITATATVTSPTDISSLLTEATSTYGYGTLVVPSVDTAYLVTLSNARFPAYPTIETKGVEVSLPNPGTGGSHWIRITYTIADATRRVFHAPLARNWRAQPAVVEPSPTVGATSSFEYAWDETAEQWYISSYSGSTATRQHGPNESSSALPLYFTPETRALGDFSDRKADTIAALANCVPSSTQSALNARSHIIDLSSALSGAMPQFMFARGFGLDPTYNNTASGVYILGSTKDPEETKFINGNAERAVDRPEALDGRTMLHEMGHAWDYWAMVSNGDTWGINPGGDGSPNAYDTVSRYYEGGALNYTYEYTPTEVTVTVYDTDGTTVIFGQTSPRPQYALISDEVELRDMYDALPDKSGYYRSNRAEWHAQCLMLCWADHYPTVYRAGTRSTLVTQIGGESVLTAFRSYVVSIGALPSSW